MSAKRRCFGIVECTAIGFSDRRACRRNDDCFSHVVVPDSVFLLAEAELFGGLFCKLSGLFESGTEFPHTAFVIELVPDGSDALW
jgi:hypothetical protein